MYRILMVSLLLAAPLWAEPPRLVIPAEVRPAGEYATLQPDTDAVSVMYIGLSGVDGFPSAFLKDSRSFILPVRGLAEGQYKFVAIGAGKTGEQVRVDFVVTVGTPPTPPGPGPGPKPPEPPPGPAPIPGDGLQVLFVYEGSRPLTREESAIISGKAVRDKLTAACGKEWRVYDKDAPMDHDTVKWKVAMARPRTALPWVIISNPKGASYEGPLPKTADEFLKLLAKHGG